MDATPCKFEKPGSFFRNRENELFVVCDDEFSQEKYKRMSAVGVDEMSVLTK